VFVSLVDASLIDAELVVYVALVDVGHDVTGTSFWIQMSCLSRYIDSS